MRQHNVALVVGAQGIIGQSIVQHLATLDDWEVIGVARRRGEDGARSRHVSVDLLDLDATRRALGELRQVTHVFYAAYQDRPTFAELVAPNVAMLANVLEAVEPAARGLRHISLMQGYKLYGAHLGPFKTPARESDPPHMPPEFNVDQQALLVDRARGRTWTWSAIRPPMVIGFALGIPMNLAAVIGVYASMCKELGVPLRFPGKPGAYDSLLELVDAGMLARATVWAATEERCAGEAFNVANGDLFRWSEMWPRIAETFGVEVAPPLPLSLASVMSDKEPLWNAMVERHGLARTPYREVSAWAFGDAVFGGTYDMFGDTSKLRRFGFHEHVETEAMLRATFAEYRRRRVLP
jgi:nucleoside-diphosphate-sugar epimerase